MRPVAVRALRPRSKFTPTVRARARFGAQMPWMVNLARRGSFERSSLIRERHAPFRMAGSGCYATGAASFVANWAPGKKKPSSRFEAQLSTA